MAGKQRSLGENIDSLIAEGVKRGDIIQTGYVSDDDICRLYAHAICAVYLSKAEGFGLPLIEAMSCGCPIITTRRTSLPEIGGMAACYVDRNDKYAVISLMLELENNKEYRDKCIEKGYTNLERFQWEDSARNFLDILKNMKGRTQDTDNNAIKKED